MKKSTEFGSSPITEEQRMRFDAEFEKILDSLPSEFRVLLDEIPVIVDDEPGPHVLEELGIRRSRNLSDLCGAHWGVPLDERNETESRLSPDRIQLFRGPIYRLSDGNKSELTEQIRITLLHELGHHFGLDEDELDRLGYG